MKSRALLLLLALVACLAVVVISCSDDDNSSPTGTVTPGNPSDSNFQYIQENFAGTGDFFDFGGDVEIAVALINQTTGIDLSKAPARTGPFAGLAADEDTVTSVVITDWEFTAENWLVIDFSLTLLEIECDPVCDTTAILIAGIDSAQFLDDGVPLDTSEVASGFNGLIQRAYITYDIDDGDGTTIGANSARRLAITVGVNNNDSLLQADVNINESVSIVADEGTGMCMIDVQRAQVVNDMIVNTQDPSEGSCPLSGSASITDVYSVSCTGSGQNEVRELNIDGTWTVTAIVNQDGSVTVTFTSGGLQWVDTIPAGQCD